MMHHQQNRARRGGYAAASQNPSLRWTSPSYGGGFNNNYHNTAKTPTVNVTEGYSRDSRTGSPAQFLREFCRKSNLAEPVFKTISIGKSSEKTFNCKVTVLDLCGQDPAARDETIEKAQDHAASILLSKMEMQPKVICALIKHEELNIDWENVMDRIKGILFSKPNGMWDYKLEALYRSTYCEEIPAGWFEMAKGCDYFQVPNPNARIIDLAHQTQLPELQIPESDFYKVLITCVENVDKVWVNFVKSGDGAHGLFEVTNELEAAVSSGALQFGMKIVHENTFCIARVNANLARAKILSPNLRGAICFMIDSGEKMFVPLSELAVLPCKCKKLAPQAVQIALHGLNMLASHDTRVIDLALKVLSGKMFNAATVVGANLPLELILFEETHDLNDRPINSMLIEEIVNGILLPNLPEANGVARRVVVTHISEGLDLFVQPQPEVARWLEFELQIACSELFQQNSPDRLFKGDTYVAILINEGNEAQPITFKRASVLSSKKVGLCTMAEVLFIDSGVTATLPQFRLKNFPDCHIDFKKIRPQAIKCLMKSDLCSPEELMKLLPPSGIVSLSTVSPGSDLKLPLVDIQLC